MELSSIAKPYAQAIFEVAEQSNSISAWSSFLATACAVLSDESTKAFIASPGKSKKNKLLFCSDIGMKRPLYFSIVGDGVISSPLNVQTKLK